MLVKKYSNFNTFMNLPSSFVSRSQALFCGEWDAFVNALQQPTPTSIRVNDKQPLLYAESVPWCQAGYYLPQRPQFTFDPLFHAGCYYVQEASSMFLWQALNQYVPKNSTVLDLCAAPGGKSTLTSQYLGNDGFLVSNEIIRSRAYILSENLQKWGNGNALVCNNQPKDLGRLTSLFDAVLVDAPCSGEGMFRKDAGAIAEWSEDNVRMCAARQREILSDVWDALKPGGVLVYSTCTYNREENEDNVQWICSELGAEYLPLQISADWQITDGGWGYHFYPHKTRGEGFFLAVMRKNELDDYSSFRQKQPRTNRSVAIPPVKDWLLHSEEWEWMWQENQPAVRAVPKRYADFVKIMISNLSCIMCGIEVLVEKGKNLIPQQSLALSKHLNREKFTTFDVDLDTALAFLRTEALILPPLALGYVLITYQSVPLGWVKNVGNRCNNLYPNEWRIRKNAN